MFANVGAFHSALGWAYTRTPICIDIFKVMSVVGKTVYCVQSANPKDKPPVNSYIVQTLIVMA